MRPERCIEATFAGEHALACAAERLALHVIINEAEMLLASDPDPEERQAFRRPHGMAPTGLSAILERKRSRP